MTQLVTRDDAAHFLTDLNVRECVDQIITSPPYAGLPGRADTFEIVEAMIGPATRALADNGSVVLIVGAAGDDLLLGSELARLVPGWSAHQLELRYLHVWDRSGTLARKVGAQTVSHDLILHFARPGLRVPTIFDQGSVVKTSMPGFNYGDGVTTPPDLAALLVGKLSDPEDLIVDPFCGFGEVGVQSLHQGRLFLGCDTSQTCVDVSNARLAEHLPPEDA